MNNKSLILPILLVLMVFISVSAVSATDDANTYALAEEGTQQEVTVFTNDTNDQIQEKINSLNDGATLTFEKGEYNDICLYVNSAKNVTINGNGATLCGRDNPTVNNTPEKITNMTSKGGLGIQNVATFYIANSNNVVLKNITIKAGENDGVDLNKPITAKTADYTNCLVYNINSTNTKITNSIFDGSSWGIWFMQSKGGLIEGNIVKNQNITGIFNFQTPNTIIRNNTVTNAKNHGIDVRHQVGSNVKVINNKVVGAKEGIYLLHSGKHTVTGNTIIGCSESSITCCGAKNILIENNTLQNSRIGILLSGGKNQNDEYVSYTNITIGNNEWKLDQLPFPPSFTFYVAEAKSDYSTNITMMGTHSDSYYGDTYTGYTEIKAPGPIVVDYDTILKPTSKNKTITSGMTNKEIQDTINSMNNGDTLFFEPNAVFENVCIYITKNLKVIGNNATLKGMSSVNYTNIPDIVVNKTTQGGYAIPNIAVLYILNTTNAVISNLNIVANYPKYTMPCKMGDNENYRAYYSTGIYGGLSKKLVITGCAVDGASWGIFLGGRPDESGYKYGCQNVTITNNIVKNQYTTGIISFASPNSIIANNTVTNAVNHGIDVRFPAGFGAKIFNNTISGAKEGIYLLHSYGHYVYNNTILNSKISSITCYGSHDEYIFNNTLTKSRVAILLGGSSGQSYYNVTIGANKFTGDTLPFPPTFAFTLAKTENNYNNATTVMRTYSDKELVTISAPNVTIDANADGELQITLIDQNKKAMAGKTIAVTLNKENQTVTTDENGTAKVGFKLAAGNYNATISFAGSDNYAKASATAKITVKPVQPVTPTVTKKIVKITAAKKTFKAKTKTKKYTITLKSGKTAVKKVKVTLKVGKKTYKATTNTKGKATFKITKLTKKGKYTATIKFAGNSVYQKANKKVKITVKK